MRNELEPRSEESIQGWRKTHLKRLKEIVTDDTLPPETVNKGRALGVTQNENRKGSTFLTALVSCAVTVQQRHVHLEFLGEGGKGTEEHTKKEIKAENSPINATGN